MTICVENGWVEGATRRRIHRQKSVDMLEECTFFEDSSSLETVTEDSTDSSVSDSQPTKNFYRAVDGTSFESRQGLRRTISVESISSRRKNKSSLILNWLTNPDNKIMYQGKHIDSKIFRSHSAVESRTCSIIPKHTRYHSFRQQDKASLDDVGTSISQQKQWTSENEIPRDYCTDLTCVKVPVMTKDIIEPPCALQHTTSQSDQAVEMESSEQKTIDETQFSSYTTDMKNIDKDNGLSFDFSELSLICNEHNDERSTAIDAKSHRKVRSFNSLPNYGRCKQVKLRRMHSDALFYTGGCRNCDKRKKSEFRGRSRLSFQSRDRLEKERLLKTAGVGGSLRTCQDRFELSEKVNSHAFINNIEKIFANGDLELIQALAECGFDFNVKDDSGNCALHYAAQRGSEKIITEILENGGNVWVRNNNNQLPVELASNMNVRMLLSGVTLFYRGQYSIETESRLTSKKMGFEL